VNGERRHATAAPRVGIGRPRGRVGPARYSLPALTTVDAGPEQIAEVAVALLVERIAEGDSRGAPREIATPFSIIGRESV
jgi:DNA-binding LacI/PurR family transcriptional regulator